MCFVCGGGVEGGGGGGVCMGGSGDSRRRFATSHLLGEEEWTRFVLLTSGDGSVGRRFIGEDDDCMVSIISVKSVSHTKLFFIGDIICGMLGCSNAFVLHQFWKACSTL